MKIKIIISTIFVAIVYTGCSTTTYFNLTKNNRYNIEMQFDHARKHNDKGTKISLLLKNKTDIYGELVSVRDNAMVLCTGNSSTEEELANSTYPIVVIQSNDIQEFTIEGSSFVWLGLGTGYLTGSIGGLLISQSSKYSLKSEKEIAAFMGIVIGGLLGSIAGGIIGHALSTEEFIFQDIPPDYDFSFVKPLTRYPDGEPEYLRAIK